MAILYEGKQGHYASEGMKAYVNNKDTCRRQLLFHDFLCFSGTELSTALCTCCIGSNFSRIASGTIATPTTDCIATSILHHIFIIILALY